MTSDMTISEMTNSLTGFDEIAIAKHFGGEFTDLAENKPTTLGRALVFVAERRDGKTDQEAFQVAMDLPLGTCQSYFADEAVDPLGEETAPDAQ